MLQVALAWLALAAAACAPPKAAPSAAAREEMLELPARIGTILAIPDVRVLGEPLRESEALVRFYTQRAHRPAWLERDGAAGERARALVEAVQQADRHGLRPDAYHAAVLEQRIAPGAAFGAGQRAALDLLLSDAFLHLARELAGGAVDPRSLHPGYERAGDPPPDAVGALASALASGEIAQTLSRVAPPHPEYAALVRALERLRAADTAGDPTAAERADRVRANLERWRWLPRDLGRRHLRVNTPGFTLQAFDSGDAVLAMRVVVGGVHWKTPLAHGVVSHLVLNPAWQVPDSIATREMLPAARRNPDYFASVGIQVLVDEKSGTPRLVNPRRVDWKAVAAETFPYRLRQPPGPHNPLGRIKFIFPNRYGVYLHGTPGDAAFSRPLRTLSHGCVRVEDELALAAFALAPDPARTRERLLESLRNAWEHRVPLPAPLPVYLLYFTASAGADGTPSFTDDAYGWDRQLVAALASESPASGEGSRAASAPSS
jgi:murein L,D-transpeptidase YcbB/YkuD